MNRSFWMCFYLSCCLHWSSLRAEPPPLAIFGGTQNPGVAYAALIDYNGNVFQIPGVSSNAPFPFAGNINSVTIGESGLFLIGGINGIDSESSYVAFVTPAGVLIPVSGSNLPSVDGEIHEVVMNAEGLCLVGGDLGSNAAYAAFLGVNQLVSEITGGGLPASGTIFSVALNKAGSGLIGGTNDGDGSAYAALVTLGQEPVPLSDSNPIWSSGIINSVALNDQGKGLIGGQVNSGLEPPYAAFVSLNGTLTPLTSPTFSQGQGIIYSVDINKAGVGLIGGQAVHTPYAAMITSDGTLIELSNLGPAVQDGAILSVALNESGVGLIGGQTAGSVGGAYAAFILPNGELRPLFGGGLPPFGSDGAIKSVSINNAGVGLIVGDQDFIPAGGYVALVAPNGTLTRIDGANLLATTKLLLSASLAEDAMTPQSIGPYGGAFQTQLGAIRALASRVTIQSQQWRPKKQEAMIAGEIPPTCQKPRYTLWTTPFGALVHQAGQDQCPRTNHGIAGILAAFEYHIPRLLVGGGFCYGYDWMHYGTRVGSGSVQEEMAFFYSSVYPGFVWIHTALWGGAYQFTNKRNSPLSITSTSESGGWLLTPHIEVAAPLSLRSFCFEPFLSCDWINNWQCSFTEKGASGFNLVMPALYSSLIRSEIGLRFYEECSLYTGKWIFEQKTSYINQMPFHSGKVTSFFVESVSPFAVAIGPSHVQNLGCVMLSASFLPYSPRYPSMTLQFQGEGGSSYQSYSTCLEVGKNF